MPEYDFQCPKCKLVYNYILSFTEYDELKRSKPRCKDHPRTALEQVILEAPSMTVPASFSYDGKVKSIGSTPEGKRKARETLDVPLNIITEKPDGSCTVTRIGKKSDIENE